MKLELLACGVFLSFVGTLSSMEMEENDQKEEATFTEASQEQNIQPLGSSVKIQESGKLECTTLNASVFSNTKFPEIVDDFKIEQKPNAYYASIPLFFEEQKFYGRVDNHFKQALITFFNIALLTKLHERGLYNADVLPTALYGNYHPVYKKVAKSFSKHFVVMQSCEGEILSKIKVRGGLPKMYDRINRDFLVNVLLGNEGSVYPRNFIVAKDKVTGEQRLYQINYSSNFLYDYNGYDKKPLDMDSWRVKDQDGTQVIQKDKLDITDQAQTLFNNKNFILEDAESIIKSMSNDPKAVEILKGVKDILEKRLEKMETLYAEKGENFSENFVAEFAELSLNK